MKIFITGGTGLLGSSFLRNAPQGTELFSNYHTNILLPDKVDCKFSSLEIKNKSDVDKLIEEIRPEIIIHTAAKSSPDFCEFNQEEATKINIEGTRNILKAGEKIRAKILIMSSNQVFSGKNPPYSESSTLDPVNFYGKSKVQNEEDALKTKGALVVRPMTMYGWGNPNGQKNTAMWVLEMLSAKKPIKVVNDIFNNFLSVEQCAKLIWQIAINKVDFRIINIAGAEIADRYTFAQKVADAFNLNKSLISAVPKSYFQEEAPRPLNTIYDTKLIEEKLKTRLLNLNEGLEEMKNIQQKVKWKTLSQ